MIVNDEMLNHIKKNAIASIGSDGLVGSMLINIVPGRGSGKLISSGDELQSFSKIGTQDMLSTLNVTNENAALLTADLLQISQSLTKGNGTLGQLLNDSTMATDLKQTITNLKRTSNQANATFTKLNELMTAINFEESTAGVLLSDTISAGKMRNIIANLETSSIMIQKMSEDLNGVFGDVTEGKGALKYLSKDSTLVHQLERTMKNIEQGTDRFNENMEALKHNFLTRGYFKKLERQEKKEAQSNQN